MDPLDQPIKAVCECKAEQRVVTFRQLKNRWPRCRCNQSMKVLPDATTTLHPADGMGHARCVPPPRGRKGSSD